MGEKFLASEGDSVVGGGTGGIECEDGAAGTQSQCQGVGWRPSGIDLRIIWTVQSRIGHA